MEIQPDQLSTGLFTNEELNAEIVKEKKDIALKTIKEPSEFDAEYIDLTNEYPLDYGTKKCSCKCHELVTSLQKGELVSEEIILQQQFGHCLLCSLKLIKGKLCIKCEGKKGMTLNYKIS